MMSSFGPPAARGMSLVALTRSFEREDLPRLMRFSLCGCIIWSMATEMRCSRVLLKSSPEGKDQEFRLDGVFDDEGVSFTEVVDGDRDAE